MLKFSKTIKISCFITAISATITSYDLNLATAQEKKLLKTSFGNQELIIELKSTRVFPLQADAVSNRPMQQSQQDRSMLIVDSSILNVANNKSKTKEFKLKLTRLISRSFFLIFFIPCGIFYPLFLFYRRLLGVGRDELDDSQLESNHPQFLEPNYSQILDVDAQEESQDSSISNATVSKLQIAFSPQALTLRQKLGQISSSAEHNREQDVVDLMCKTVLALVSHQDWTHVNYSSVSLPLDQVKAEFDLVSQTERIKCRSRKLSLVNRDRDRISTGNSYRYVVVTLILCTTHNFPLFSKINTEAQLIEELAQLSKMERESLIKFELLWNPQKEGTYLNNDQLLTEYSEMIRLL